MTLGAHLKNSERGGRRLHDRAASNLQLVLCGGAAILGGEFGEKI
jgi:hypothetical protein